MTKNILHFWKVCLKTFLTYFKTYSFDKNCGLCIDELLGLVHGSNDPKSIKISMLEYSTWTRALFGCYEKNEIVSAQPITLQTSKLTHDAMCDDVYTIKRDFWDYLRNATMAQRWDRGSNAKIYFPTPPCWGRSRPESSLKFTTDFQSQRHGCEILSFCVWPSISSSSHCSIPYVVSKDSLHLNTPIAQSMVH